MAPARQGHREYSSLVKAWRPYEVKIQARSVAQELVEQGWVGLGGRTSQQNVTKQLENQPVPRERAELPCLSGVGVSLEGACPLWS